MKLVVPGVQYGRIAEPLDRTERRAVVEQQLEVGRRAAQREVALSVLVSHLDGVRLQRDEPFGGDAVVGAVHVQRLTRRLARASAGQHEPAEQLVDTVGRERRVDRLARAAGGLRVVTMDRELVRGATGHERRGVIAGIPRPHVGARRRRPQLRHQQRRDLCEPGRDCITTRRVGHDRLRPPRSFAEHVGPERAEQAHVGDEVRDAPVGTGRDGRVDRSGSHRGTERVELPLRGGNVVDGDTHEREP